jgi:ubiquinone/menaquinone biosynthesis C-methylase UbiE
MSIKDAYNIWSEQYDSNKNFTRDLEGDALRSILGNFRFDTCLEMGCGTGKNTNWLLSKANNVVAVDFSEAMLAKAKEKIGDSGGCQL